MLNGSKAKMKMKDIVRELVIIACYFELADWKG